MRCLLVTNNVLLQRSTRCSANNQLPGQCKKRSKHSHLLLHAVVDAPKICNCIRNDRYHSHCERVRCRQPCAAFYGNRQRMFSSLARGHGRHIRFYQDLLQVRSNGVDFAALPLRCASATLRRPRLDDAHAAHGPYGVVSPIPSRLIGRVDAAYDAGTKVASAASAVMADCRVAKSAADRDPSALLPVCTNARQ